MPPIALAGFYEICVDGVFVDGGLSNNCIVLLVDNEPPITSNVVVTPNPSPVNGTVALTAIVDDVSTGGSVIASAEYSIDGGPASPMTAMDGTYNEQREDVQATLSSLSEAAVHEICVTGVDAGGNRSDPGCVLLAVYDPSGGFVTGAGWIDSPAGACPSFCNDATGKATFGFVSRYQKGASTPTGQTEFRFNAGDLDFHSTGYDWLVVAGPNAKYKGSGRINRDGDYGFMLTATDSDVNGGGTSDKFRIKIWDHGNNDAVVYDNKAGEGDESYAGTEIGGGNIKIHKGNSAKMEGEEPAVGLPANYALHDVYPNPFNPSTTLAFDLPEESEVRLLVYNTLGQVVGRLAEGTMPAGTHRLTFDATGLPSGMYIARLETGGGTFTRRMMLVK